MLIITRRPGEKIMVGDEVVVHVMEIVGNSVRVGIEAPRSVPVYREEIWNAVRDENRAAADSGSRRAAAAGQAGRLNHAGAGTVQSMARTKLCCSASLALGAAASSSSATR